jgi:homeobox protein ESX1
LVQTAGVLPPGGLLHPRPALQVEFAQHGWPSPPQGWQLSPPSTVWQDRPDWQDTAAPPLQHGWPVAPQAPHVPLAQIAPGPVQVPPAPASFTPQHACVAAPHGVVPFWQEPLVHIPLVPEPEQAVPAAVHSPVPAPMQHPPFMHTRVAQHALPGRPQAFGLPPVPPAPVPPRPALPVVPAVAPAVPVVPPRPALPVVPAVAPAVPVVPPRPALPVVPAVAPAVPVVPAVAPAVPVVPAVAPPAPVVPAVAPAVPVVPPRPALPVVPPRPAPPVVPPLPPSPSPPQAAKLTNRATSPSRPTTEPALNRFFMSSVSSAVSANGLARASPLFRDRVQKEI